MPKSKRTHKTANQAANPTADIRSIAVTDIHPSPTNPRKILKGIDELAASIASKGLLQPIVVRPRSGGATGFEIVCGERRWRAAKQAKLTAVPAIVRDLDDAAVLEIQVIENDQREDVHPLDQADGYAAILKQGTYDVASLAAKIGRPEAYVRQRLQLTNLAPHVRKLFAADKLLLGHVMLIARLTEAQQDKLMKEWILNGVTSEYGNSQMPSVKSLQEHIEELFHLNLKSALFPKDDAELVKAAGACTTCPKRTGNAPGLWPEVTKDDTCTDPACFKKKEQAYVKLTVERAVTKDPAVVRISVKNWNDSKAGVLGTNSYEIVSAKDAKKAKAGTIKTAVIVDQTDYTYSDKKGKKPGQVVQIRVKAKRSDRSSSGGGGYGSDDWKARQERDERDRKIGAAARAEIVRQLLEKITALNLPDLVYAIASSIGNNEDLKPLIPFYGKEIDRVKQRPAALAKLTLEELGLFLVRCSVIDGERYVYPPTKIPEELEFFGKAYGVDCGAVLKAKKKELTEVDKAGEKAAEKSAKTGGKSKAGKKPKGARPRADDDGEDLDPRDTDDTDDTGDAPDASDPGDDFDEIDRLDGAVGAELDELAEVEA